MTKTLSISSIGFAMTGIFTALAFVLLFGVNGAHAAITTQLDVGSRGNQVTELQQFLATNPQIYPAGLVTGFYGPLTRAAVVQFQVAYGISQVGRVGPQTMAKINSIMSSGLGLDTHAPFMSNLSTQRNLNNATIGWTTNEPARGQVFYDTNPIQSSEATGPYQLPFIGGSPAVTNNTSSLGNSQSIQLTGLQSNTLYYYFTRAIDNSGNVSMSLMNSFRTNQ